MRRKIMLVLLGLVSLVLTGCSYYRVTDPSTNKSYYTRGEDLDRYDNSGAVQFTDAQTGTVVTLQNSEVKKITEEEFDEIVEPDG